MHFSGRDQGETTPPLARVGSIPSPQATTHGSTRGYSATQKDTGDPTNVSVPTCNTLPLRVAGSLLSPLANESLPAGPGSLHPFPSNPRPQLPNTIQFKYKCHRLYSFNCPPSLHLKTHTNAWHDPPSPIHFQCREENGLERASRPTCPLSMGDWAPGWPLQGLEQASPPTHTKELVSQRWPAPSLHKTRLVRRTQDRFQAKKWGGAGGGSAFSEHREKSPSPRAIPSRGPCECPLCHG